MKLRLLNHPDGRLALLHATIVLPFCFLFWFYPYPPTVDFPQHAAMARLLYEFVIGNEAVRSAYELKLFTPYLIPTAFASALTAVFGAIVAMKLLFTIAFIAFPLSVWWFIRRVGGDENFSLLAYSLSCGWLYHWGLVPFFFSISLAIVAIAESVICLNEESTARRLRVVGLFILLFFCHFLALVIALIISGALLLARATSFRQFIKAASLMLPGTLTGLYWYWTAGESVEQVSTNVIWGIDPERIFLILSSISFGHLGDRPNAVVAFLGLVVIAVLSAPRIRTIRLTWIPLTFIIALYALTPVDYHDVFILGRYAFFALPLIVCSVATTRKVFNRALLVSVFLFVSAALLIREQRVWSTVSPNVKDAISLLSLVPSENSVLGLIYNKEERGVSAPSYLHVASYHQALTAGTVSSSFSLLSHHVMRRNNVSEEERSRQSLLSWSPEEFDIDQDGYDYYLLRHKQPEDEERFLSAARGAVKLINKKNSWKLYQRSKKANRSKKSSE